ncbi:MAG: hypothetical protein EOP63_14325 [Sphingomonadales bacterium]|nr:MAG: hypothetical protein EOP63_14325 [Sphingomonadales bacterium]
MALQIGSELTCSMGVKDMTAAIGWYERVMQCKLLYRADAKAHLDAEGVRQDGDIQHIPGLVRLITFYDPDGNALMFSQSEIAA